MRVLVLISGNGTNLQAIINERDNLKINIVGVISNNEDAPGLQRAIDNNIPTKILMGNKFGNRELYDNNLVEITKHFNPDLIILAGWMRILTPTFLNEFPGQIINLHPALPGTFIGANCIEKAWASYIKGDIIDTGVMTHWVTPECDKGDSICTLRIPIYGCSTLTDLTERIQTFEKNILISTIQLLRDLSYTRHNDIGFNSMKNKDNITYHLVQKGKVRDVYDIGHGLLGILHSNRLSSFDRYICDVPHKGHILTETSAFWFKKINDHLNIPNHYLYSKKNMMIVKKCTPFPIEVIVRGYITGNTSTSLWTHYDKGVRDYCGITFPDGLKKNQKLENNVITPTTKGEVDELITGIDIIDRKIMTEKQWKDISRMALQLFEYGQEYANERGFILVDTKYEFGLDSNNNIMLIDEVHTCDSSRYWIKLSYADRFAKGEEPEKYDKDIIRDYIKLNIKNPYLETKFDIPLNKVQDTSYIYNKFYKILTEDDLNPDKTYEMMDVMNVNENKEIINYYYNHIHYLYAPHLVILSGSKSDNEHVHKIKQFAKKSSIMVHHHVCSAHKNTQGVLDILNKYNSKKGKIIFVTVAGRSNALSGVVASNTEYPTIACPPFENKLDMATNINSTLQCPSNVPVMTILEPCNVVLSAIKIFTLLC
jgi:phosphoribosylaminoimidazole-succinocarboxamide synthase